MHVDVSQFVGMAGVPFIEQAVEYLKDNMRLPVYLAPIAALVIGVLFNLCAAFYFHQSLGNAVVVGLFAGFGSSFWHELAKPNNS